MILHVIGQGWQGVKVLFIGPLATIVAVMLLMPRRVERPEQLNPKWRRKILQLTEFQMQK